MPAIFFGHGNPMNAVLHNSYSEGWRRVGEQMLKPKAILSVSAHWFVPETAVTISTAPSTIHDFGGFPRELNRAQPVSARSKGRRLDGLWNSLGCGLARAGNCR